MSRKIHFVYTVPLGKTKLRRGLDKLIKILHLPPLYRSASDFLIPWQKPIRAPHSISYNLLAYFRTHAKTRFYNIYEKGTVELGSKDIFIAQPLPRGGFNESRPDTDESSSITSATIRNNPRAENYLIMPYTHDPLYVSWARDIVRANKAGGLIIVGGKIWERNWHTSPFVDIDIPRKVHVEMGIDPQDYPLVRKKFNEKGRRKYLYIGHTSWYKNTKELERIAERMPNYEFAHIGGGEVKGWKKISSFASLTPEFMSKLSETYDIFVNTSTADAQATTILEQMCFGFIVATTHESGYDHPSLVQLSPTDTESNVKILTELQFKEESELMNIVRENRKTAEEKHTWKKFTDTIGQFIGLQ